MEDSPTIRLGDLVLNRARGYLEDATGAELFLRPKSYRLLEVLCERRGELISKDDLVRAVWPDVFVSDDSLAHCVSDIRRALGPDAARLLRTMPRRGYMLASEPTIDCDATAPDPAPKELAIPSPAIRSKRWPISIISGLAVAVIAIGAAGNFWWRPEAKVEATKTDNLAFPLPNKPSIAVLPFINISDDASQEYFVDGMTEDLITDLSTLSGLFVISRNSTFTYKGKLVEPRQVAEELGVRYVLEGSVRRNKGEVRVNAQLIDATTGGHVWASRFDDRIDNIFDLQDRITSKIFAALSVRLPPGEQANLGRDQTHDIEAYDAFLKGWELYRQWRPESFRDALPWFERAIALDPEYGKAYAAIASIYTEGYVKAWDWSHVVGVSAEAMPGLAGDYLKAALKHPTPFAHQVASKWYVILQFPDEAIAEAARGIALDPNDPVGYSAMATALIYRGKPAEAIDFINKAMRFDPNNTPNYLFTLGMAYFGMERFEQAATVFETAFEINPELGLVQKAYLAAAYVHRGEGPKADALLHNPKIREVRDLYDLYVRYEAAYYQNDQDRLRLVGALNQIDF